MQISEHVYAARVSFRVQIGPERYLDRFVYVFLVRGEKVNLIDTGIAGCQEAIWGLVRESGRTASEIGRIILTHSHPDHIGGVFGLQKALFGSTIAAHSAEVRWIEDVEQQYRERSFPGFHALVEGSVKVNQLLDDGNAIELGDKSTLKVIHTPGHSKGHIALHHEQDGVLISADSIPLPNDIPIYEDVFVSLGSIEKLRLIQGVRVLLASWDEPRYGDEVQQVLVNGAKQIRKLHRLVLNAKDRLRSSDTPTVARQVLEGLGLPQTAFNPLFLRTIEGHLRADDSPERQEI